MSELRTLYPKIEPFDTGCLKVSPVHELYYEQCGNPEGKPVVFLHGGPGAGLVPVSTTCGSGWVSVSSRPSGLHLTHSLSQVVLKWLEQDESFTCALTPTP